MRTAPTIPAGRLPLAYDQVVPLPGGHTLFHMAEDAELFAGRWAIADRSGRTPWTTDDGTLLVAADAVIELGTRHIRLPLEQVADDAGLTPTGASITPADVPALAATLGLEVSRPGGRRYRLIAAE